MKYQEHYDKLVSRAKERKLDCYTESHHIIPKCIGGTDDKDNLVQLTAREHFIAHLLLWKIHPESYGLIKAVNMMCMSGKNQERSMNRMYGWLKEKFSVEMSINQSGKKHSQFETMWIYNLELKENKKVPKGDSIPDGWFKGRKMSFEEKVKIKKCKVCGETHTRNSKFCSEKCYNESSKMYITTEYKEKMSNIKKGIGVNEKNSQFGTIWIFQPIIFENKKIKVSDLNLYPGWIRGRWRPRCSCLKCKKEMQVFNLKNHLC